MMALQLTGHVKPWLLHLPTLLVQYDQKICHRDPEMDRQGTMSRAHRKMTSNANVMEEWLVPKRKH